MVVRKVMDGKDIPDKRQQPCHERPALRFRHLTGELVLHDFMQDVVPGIVEPSQQLRHRQLLRAVGGIAFQPGTLVGFCGTVGTSLYECRVVLLFKLVLLEVIQQVQPVIGQFGLLFLVLLVHIFLDLVDE